MLNAVKSAVYGFMGVRMLFFAEYGCSNFRLLFPEEEADGLQLSLSDNISYARALDN